MGQAMRKPEVSLIPATKERAERGRQIRERETLRVAAYCRVSTGDENQQTSYMTQKNFYTGMINGKPGWTLAGIYADEAISGTSRAGRRQFNEMMEDAVSGKMDYIVTKSISRFARNTVDTLNCVRQLRQLDPPVGIYFEKENIDTLDAAGELVLTILSALAQDESRSISENIRWSIQKKFQRGEVIVDLNRMLGYDRGPEGEWVINPEQAEIVRYIYSRFVCGASGNAIARELNNMGKKTARGCIWRSDSVLFILRNEKYVGDCESQKTITKNFLTHETAVNNGEAPRYYIRDHHEGIIDRLTWEKVQAMLQKQGSCKVSCPEAGKKRRGPESSPFSNLFWEDRDREGNGTFRRGKMIRMGYNRLAAGYTDGRSLAAQGLDPSLYKERYYYYYPVWRKAETSGRKKGNSGEAAGWRKDLENGNLGEAASRRQESENRNWGETASRRQDLGKENWGETASRRQDLEKENSGEAVSRRQESESRNSGKIAGRKMNLENKTKNFKNKGSQIKKTGESGQCASGSYCETALEQSFMEMLYAVKRDYEANGENSRLAVQFREATKHISLRAGRNRESAQRLELLRLQMEALTEELKSLKRDRQSADSRNEGRESRLTDAEAEIRRELAERQKEYDALEADQGEAAAMQKKYDFFIRCLKNLPETNRAGMPLRIYGMEHRKSIYDQAEPCRENGKNGLRQQEPCPGPAAGNGSLRGQGKNGIKAGKSIQAGNSGQPGQAGQTGWDDQDRKTSQIHKTTRTGQVIGTGRGKLNRQTGQVMRAGQILRAGEADQTSGAGQILRPSQTDQTRESGQIIRNRLTESGEYMLENTVCMELFPAPDYLEFEKGIYLAFIREGIVRGDEAEYMTNFGVRLTSRGNSRMLEDFLGFRKCGPDGTVELLDQCWKVSGRGVCYTRRKTEKHHSMKICH